jgi:hypothetical protein
MSLMLLLIALVPPPVTSSVFVPVPLPIVAPIVALATMTVSLPLPRLTVSCGLPIWNGVVAGGEVDHRRVCAPMIVIVGAFGFPEFSEASELTSTVPSSPLRSVTI